MSFAVHDANPAAFSALHVIFPWSPGFTLGKISVLVPSDRTAILTFGESCNSSPFLYHQISGVGVPITVTSNLAVVPSGERQWLMNLVKVGGIRASMIRVTGGGWANAIGIGVWCT